VVVERCVKAVVLDELAPVLDVLASPSLPLIVGVGAETGTVAGTPRPDTFAAGSGCAR
jgi:hypothetical protein